MIRVRTAVIVSLLFFSVLPPFAMDVETSSEPPNIEWSHTYGGANNEEAYCVRQTSDSGYIAVGYTMSYGAGHQDSWLVKTDSAGNMIWSKTYGGSNNDWAASVQQTSDAGYIVAGSTESYGAGTYDFWLIKTDSAGNMMWSKTYGGASLDEANSVQQTNDGGYVIAGYTSSYGAGGDDFWLVKTDSAGNMIWSKTYGGSEKESASSVQQTSDGGYIVAGVTMSYGAGSDDFWLVKTDPSGNMIWSKTYGGSLGDFACSVQQTYDGGYIIAGYTNAYQGSVSLWLVKTDSAGNMIWNNTYGRTYYDAAYSVHQTTDGGYIVAGLTASYGASPDFWVAKTDSAGNMVWSNTYGGTYYDAAYSVRQTSDGGYIVSGGTGSFGAGNGDFWLIKLAPEQAQPVHDVTTYKVEPEKLFAALCDPVPITIGIKNEGDFSENVNVEIWVGSTIGVVSWCEIGLIVVNNLQPNEAREFTGLDGFWWWTKGYEEGEYRIRVIAERVEGETILSNNWKDSVHTVTLRNLCGYAIIVAGADLNDDARYWIDRDCNLAYDALLTSGFTEDRIAFLKYPTSAAAIEWEIKYWAMAHVNEQQPLLLFICGHGDYETFLVDTGSFLLSGNLRDWLHELKTRTNAPIHVILDFCHSGSFLNELSQDVDLTITSCKDNESSYWWFHRTYGGCFALPFWHEVSKGSNLAVAFYYTCVNIAWLSDFWNESQTPQLDDNHDGIGSTGLLPRDTGGDGEYAEQVFIGHCQWLFPYMSRTTPLQCFTWSPPESVTLWAKVENNTSMRNVTAVMIPPDYSPGETEILDLGFFEMSDSNMDGNYTVNIPAVNFTNHASGPSSFRFAIIAEQENNVTSSPCFSNVIFTATGQPPADISQPILLVTRPFHEDMVHGTISINGTIVDDACLQKAELYVDESLDQTINLPTSSESFYEFSLDTTLLPNGAHTLLVKSYDTADNSANRTLTIYVLNDVHDVATTNVNPSRSCFSEGVILKTEVTIVNQGSYAENITVSFRINSTTIETREITDLPVDALATVSFTWDTTGSAEGNYTVSAVAEAVTGEGDTNDNIFTCMVTVSILGDLNGDFRCDCRDLFQMGIAFDSDPSIRRWNPNADLNNDRRITSQDLSMQAPNYGRTYP